MNFVLIRLYKELSASSNRKGRFREAIQEFLHLLRAVDRGWLFLILTSCGFNAQCVCRLSSLSRFRNSLGSSEWSFLLLVALAARRVSAFVLEWE